MNVKILNGCTSYSTSHNPDMSVKTIVVEPDKDNPRKMNIVAEGMATEVYSFNGEFIIKGVKYDRV